MSSVLVVVDMQRGFVSAKAAHIVPRVRHLVEQWERVNGGDTLFTRFLNEPGSAFERLIRWSRFMPTLDDGTVNPETEIVDELAPHAARAVAVLDKPGRYTPFDDQFRRLAAERGWDELVVCGIATESCVMKTACDAFEAGLTPYVVTDACYSHAGATPHEAGLLTIKRFIGRDQMVTIDSVVASHVKAA